MFCRQTTSFYVPVWFLAGLRLFIALYFAAELLVERYTTRASLNTPPCSDCGYRCLSGGELSTILAIVTSSTSHSSTAMAFSSHPLWFCREWAWEPRVRLDFVLHGLDLLRVRFQRPAWFHRHRLAHVGAPEGTETGALRCGGDGSGGGRRRDAATCSHASLPRSQGEQCM